MSTSEPTAGLDSAIRPGTVRAAVEALRASGITHVKSPRVAQVMGLEGTRGDHVSVGHELGRLSEEGLVRKWCPGNGTVTWEILDPEEERSQGENPT